ASRAAKRRRFIRTRKATARPSHQQSRLQVGRSFGRRGADCAAGEANGTLAVGISMVDREDPPPAPGAAGALSADEADRLSERFRPSWEAGEGNAGKPPEPPLKKQTLVGLSPASHPPPASAAQDPPRPRAKQTLIGIAPVQLPSSPPAPAPAAAAAVEPPIPTPPPPPVAAANPQGAARQTPPNVVAVLASPDGPRGIAKKYRPKDDPSAPAVVLTDEVANAEARQRAQEEAERTAQHSKRRAATVMNMRVPDIPGLRPARPKRSGTVRLLIGGAALLAVIVLVLKLATPDSPSPLPPQEKLAPVRIATPEAPPPPAVDTPRSGAPTVELSSAELPVGPAPAKEAAIVPVRPSKHASASAGQTATKSTSQPQTSPPSAAKKSGVIVRDTPF
ncbi:MAG TPA: hypothetical protein VGP93_02470, partial [Polyangiaceae bacterium]|nr:hypothetical protein [Polyangiaceae bacterium]